jgi:Rps23 Pro-64 3,4-dihydroxylase Tpa1-like proline 4-hydroxylase
MFKTLVIENFIDAKTRFELNEFCKLHHWKLINKSTPDVNYMSWVRILENESEYADMIKHMVEIETNLKLKTVRLKINGQTHGQCGVMHTDIHETNTKENLTLILFINDFWNPIWGGHLLVVEDNKTHSYIPEVCKAVILDSSLPHVGLEPTKWCESMRMTWAQQFEILGE